MIITLSEYWMGRDRTHGLQLGDLPFELRALAARWQAAEDVSRIGSSDRRASDRGCVLEECAEELLAILDRHGRTPRT